MNKEDFVTYEQALALKKLRFIDLCLYNYDSSKNFVPNSAIGDKDEGITTEDLLESHNFFKHERTDAPTIAQAQKWLRVNHKLFVTTNTYFKNYRVGDFSKPEYEYIIVDMRRNNAAYRTSSYKKEIVFNTPEEALLTGITECLKLLEKEE